MRFVTKPQARKRRRAARLSLASPQRIPIGRDRIGAQLAFIEVYAGSACRADAEWSRRIGGRGHLRQITRDRRIDSSSPLAWSIPATRPTIDFVADMMMCGV